MLRFFPELWRRLQYLVHKQRLDAELREEMATHRAMLARESDEVTARQRLGNTTRWHELASEIWGWSWLESFARDVLYGARLLRKSPGFTATACLSLALGLGATTGIFSLMNALLFKQLPVPHPEQLWSFDVLTSHGGEQYFSYRLFDALREANHTGTPLFGVGGDQVLVKDDMGTHNLPAAIVSGDAFALIGLHAYLGRLLDPEDDTRGVTHGANCVLSYRMWQDHFRADPNVLGKHLWIGPQSFTIVGVTPPSFFGFYVGAYSELFLPFTGYAVTNPGQPILDSAGWSWIHILARVTPNESIKPLVAGLNTVYRAALSQAEPKASEEERRARLYAESASNGLSAIRARFSKPLAVLLAMTGAILLIACANLANLLMARSLVRSREIAIRLAIGAHRARILRQLLTESTLVGVLGACAAIPVYFACTQGLVAFLNSGVFGNIFLDTRPDWRLISAVLTLLICTVLFFGLAPAVRALRTDLNTTLGETSHRLAVKAFMGNFVVALQVSLSLVLLVGATLLARSLFDLRTFDPGFRRDHLLIANIDTSQTIHQNPDLIRFFDRFLAGVRGLPGVHSAAASIVVPLGGTTWQGDFDVLGGGVKSQHSFENWVTPTYFETLGTPLLLGRPFDERDAGHAPAVALVNQSFARRVFGTGNPIGRQLREKQKTETITVIGIVADARYRNLRDEVPPTLYRPVAQLPPSFEFLLTLNLEVWTNLRSSEVRPQIDALLHSLDGRATADYHTFDELIDSNLLFERLLTTLSIAFGAIGLFLSATGVYGLAAYSAARRMPEVGIRMALGASPGSILSLMLSEQIRLLLVALTVGLVVALALTRFLRAWLFGVSATDPITYALVIVVIASLSLLPAWIPARRAAHLNPMNALRCE